MTQTVIVAGSTVPTKAVATALTGEEADKELRIGSGQNFLEVYDNNEKIFLDGAEALADEALNSESGRFQNVDGSVAVEAGADEANHLLDGQNNLVITDVPRRRAEDVAVGQEPSKLLPQDGPVSRERPLLAGSPDVEPKQLVKDPDQIHELQALEPTAPIKQSVEETDAALPLAHGGSQLANISEKLSGVSDKGKEQPVVALRREDQSLRASSSNPVQNAPVVPITAVSAPNPIVAGPPASSMTEAVSQANQTVQTKLEGRADTGERRSGTQSVVHASYSVALQSQGGAYGPQPMAPDPSVSGVETDFLGKLQGHAEPRPEQIPLGQSTLASSTAASTATAPPPAFYGAPPDAAKLVAQQMAVSVSQSASGTTELQLSPQELGRVRIVMSPQDVGMVVSVYTERPEVQDLMRRHIDQLAQEFRQLGFEDVSFDFQEGHAQDSESWQMRDDPSFANLEDAPEPTVIQRVILESSLDLRV